MVRHGKHRKDTRVHAFDIVCAGGIMLAGIVLLAYPFVSQLIAAIGQSSVSSRCSSEQESVSARERAEIIERARAYNRRVQRGETPLSGIGDPSSLSDLDYMGQLTRRSASGHQGREKARKARSSSSGGSADSSPAYSSPVDPLAPFATLEIPKIHALLPIRHGTSDAVLSSGVGHLYGTSLPIGGRGTNAVLAGHRGLTTSLIFTRLDEMCRGDMFYVTVFGERLSYRVDRIWVVDPQDTSHYAIDRSADYVTLLTCTPYGVNTKRLLVRGTRVRSPHSKARADWRRNQYVRRVSFAVAALVCKLGLLHLLAGRVRRWRRHTDVVGSHVRRQTHRQLLPTQNRQQSLQRNP